MYQFNPESDLEAEVLDRCIDRGYTVMISWVSQAHRELVGEDGVVIINKDYRILERIDNLMMLEVIEVSNDPSTLLAKPFKIDCDDIILITTY